MLKGKTVLLGVTGGIAAYKIANLTSMLVKLHADVHVLMTQNATNFINPITFESLTGNKCIVDTFDRNFKFKVEHIALAELADVFMIAPASANVIGKIANGIADDMLTTTFMACKKPKLVAPAMNTNMYENPIVQDNIKKLKAYGMEIIEPATGYLACGATGTGKLVSESILLEHILHKTAYKKDLAGKTVLVTAGPTRESIDPVRFISNHSTGKMGYAVARCAAMRGARVILVSGPVSIEAPCFAEFVSVLSAQEMYNAVMKYKDEADIIIKSAAVADYTPIMQSPEKIKKQGNRPFQPVTLYYSRGRVLFSTHFPYRTFREPYQFEHLSGSPHSPVPAPPPAHLPGILPADSWFPAAFLSRQTPDAPVSGQETY